MQLLFLSLPLRSSLSQPRSQAPPPSYQPTPCRREARRGSKNFILNDSLKRTSTILRVVSFFCQVRKHVWGNIKLDLFFKKAFFCHTNLNLHDLFDRFGRKNIENDDLIQTIQEFRPEVIL